MLKPLVGLFVVTRTSLFKTKLVNNDIYLLVLDTELPRQPLAKNIKARCVTFHGVVSSLLFVKKSIPAYFKFPEAPNLIKFFNEVV